MVLGFQLRRARKSRSWVPDIFVLSVFSWANKKLTLLQYIGSLCLPFRVNLLVCGQITVYYELINLDHMVTWCDGQFVDWFDSTKLIESDEIDRFSLIKSEQIKVV